MILRDHAKRRQAARRTGQPLEATIEALMSVLAYFKISRAKAKEILRQIECALSRWRKAGSALGMSDRELEQFADAFEHSERDAARKAIQRA